MQYTVKKPINNILRVVDPRAVSGSSPGAVWALALSRAIKSRPKPWSAAAA